MTGVMPAGRRRGVLTGLLIVLAVLAPCRARAQEPDRTSLVPDVLKHVVFDPTTYAPAVLAYSATRQDWTTSQPFFDHGLNEMNARFTISGLANDAPISYRDGNRKIFIDSLVILELSAVGNAAGAVVEHALVRRFPEHRTIVRRIGWAERIALAAFLSYKLSNEHFRQAQINSQLARRLGYAQ